jgi:hypothetical protein
MMIIPKTLKTKEVMRNHITMMSGMVATAFFFLVLFCGIFIVQAFFSVPFILINAVIIWFGLYPSKWNNNITVAEMYLKFLTTNRTNYIMLTREEVLNGVNFYKKQIASQEANKNRKNAEKRSY